MKVALVVPGGVDRSGEYRVIPVLLSLIKRLALIHEVHVFALLQEPQPAVWQLAGARIHNIGAKFMRTRTVRAILRENRAGAFDIVHAVWSGSGGLAAVLAAKLLRIPSMVHIAGGELVALPQIKYGGRLRWKGRLREAAVLRAATMITGASDPVIASLAALGIAAQRVPLGVDLQSWRPQEPAARAAQDPLRLVHVASLNRVKDQATLLRALQVLAAAGLQFHLEIVGEDTLNGEVQALARQLRIADRVTFRGFLRQHELRPIVAGAHLCVMCSLHETGPIAMLEAAVVGVPTVGTAVGHIAEWSPVASRAVAVGNHEHLAAAIRELMRDEDQRLSVARAAYRRATTEDADYTAAQVQRLYRHLVEAA